MLIIFMNSTLFVAVPWNLLEMFDSFYLYCFYSFDLMDLIAITSTVLLVFGPILTSSALFDFIFFPWKALCNSVNNIYYY